MRKAVSTRAMAQSDLKNVLTWATAEGWNPGLSDAAAFLSADQSGFFLTSVGEEPVAAISVVNHDQQNAFLGLYICHPDWRGRGLGFSTWNLGLAHAEERSIGLDGVPEQQTNYQSSGFVKVGSSMRHEGRIEAIVSAGIRPSMETDIEQLVLMDAHANGFARPGFMGAWLRGDEETRGTRVMDCNGEILGFAVWRACELGTKIGPIVSPDVTATLALLSDIASFRREGPLIVDVPESNIDLRKELETMGFSVPFVTARMYRGTPPHSSSTLQAIATMELG